MGIPNNKKSPNGYNAAPYICPQNYPFPFPDLQTLPHPRAHNALDRQTNRQTNRWLTGMVCDYRPLYSAVQTATRPNNVRLVDDNLKIETAKIHSYLPRYASAVQCRAGVLQVVVSWLADEMLLQQMLLSVLCYVALVVHFRDM